MKKKLLMVDCDSWIIIFLIIGSDLTAKRRSPTSADPERNPLRFSYLVIDDHADADAKYEDTQEHEDTQKCEAPNEEEGAASNCRGHCQVSIQTGAFVKHDAWAVGEVGSQARKSLGKTDTEEPRHGKFTGENHGTVEGLH